MKSLRRWLTMAVLGGAGGFIYLLPFIHEVYYLPLQQALGFTGAELGVMIATYGLVSALIYLPGGWLADRLSPRLLISASLLATGLAGFWFATWPPFEVAVGLFAFWAVTNTGGFWGAMIRATREWGAAEEQGRAFGLLETGRGLSEAAAMTGLLAVFVLLGGAAGDLAQVVVCYAALNVALGVAAWFVLRDPPARAPPRAAPRWAEVRMLLGLPQIWLVTVVVFTGYCAYWGTFAFTPYATEVFLLSVAIGAAIGAGKNWLKPMVSGVAGVLADRFGVSRTIVVLFAALVLAFGVFALIPRGSAALAPLMLATMLLAFVGVFAIRGIYFALLEEVRIPLALTGTATGIVSVLAFSPDFFMPLMLGVLRDRFPEGALAYQIQFGFIAAACLAGLCAAAWIRARYGRITKGMGDSASTQPVSSGAAGSP